MAFTGSGFQRYQAFLSPENTHIWGNELFMSLGMGLRTGLLIGSGQTFAFRHLHTSFETGSSYSWNAARNGRKEYMQRLQTSPEDREVMNRFIYKALTHYIGGMAH